MTDIPEGVPLEGVELLQGEGYNELLYSHLLDGEGTRLTYTHFTAKVYLTFISFLNYWEQNTDHTKYSILYSCHHIFFHHFLFSSLLTVPSGNLEKRSNVCKQFRVHKNRKAGASQPSSKLAAWKLLGRPIFSKLALIRWKVDISQGSLYQFFKLRNILRLILFGLYLLLLYRNRFSSCIRPFLLHKK